MIIQRADTSNFVTHETLSDCRSGIWCFGFAINIAHQIPDPKFLVTGVHEHRFEDHAISRIGVDDGYFGPGAFAGGVVAVDLICGLGNGEVWV